MVTEEKKTGGGKEPNPFSRRQFLFGVGGVLAGGAVAGIAGHSLFPVEKVVEKPVEKIVEKTIPLVVAQSQAYLVYDSKKCAGCLSCMAACSMAHEKSASLSLSRIQIAQAVMAPFPFDLEQYTCRQCSSPLCVQNYPTGACHVDTANGNVRMIDQSKCIGCQICIHSCPHPPHRTIWNPTTKKSTKCDLCADAPYLGAKGGPGGTQACVSVCPMGALSVVKTVPDQTDDIGYDLNLRAVPAASK